MRTDEICTLDGDHIGWIWLERDEDSLAFRPEYVIVDWHFDRCPVCGGDGSEIDYHILDPECPHFDCHSCGEILSPNGQNPNIRVYW
jgi:hypothetical protein